MKGWFKTPSFELINKEDFQKCIKGKQIWRVIHFNNLLTTFMPKTDEQVWLLRSRHSFWHQDRQNCPTSYLFVICVIWDQDKGSNGERFEWTIKSIQLQKKQSEHIVLLESFSSKLKYLAFFIFKEKTIWT